MSKMDEIRIKLYVTLINKNEIGLSDVPEKYREEVIKYFSSRDL